MKTIRTQVDINVMGSPHQATFMSLDHADWVTVITIPGGSITYGGENYKTMLSFLRARPGNRLVRDPETVYRFERQQGSYFVSADPVREIVDAIRKECEKHATDQMWHSAQVEREQERIKDAKLKIESDRARTAKARREIADANARLRQLRKGV